jgi:hypothetical protein
MDKALHVICLPDPLEDYDPEDPLSPSQSPAYQGLLDSRLEQVETYLQDSMPGSVEARLLVLGQSMGRPFWIETPSEEHESMPTGVMFSGRELELIATLEPDDPLFLYRYIDARAEATQKAGFDPVMDEIDIFGLYWRFDRKFPWENLPDGMQLETTPAYVDFLNNEIRTTKNPHWVEDPMRLGLRLVSAVHGTSNIPVYEEHGKIHEATAHVVEDLLLVEVYTHRLRSGDELAKEHRSRVNASRIESRPRPALGSPAGVSNRCRNRDPIARVDAGLVRPPAWDF